MDARLEQIRAQGSRNFVVTLGVIAAGVIDSHSIKGDFAEAEQFDYMDSLLITNNSAQPIEFYLNGVSDTYPILPYQIQPISRRAFRYYAVRNVGALATVAGDIVIQYRRLPPDVVPTVNVR